MARIRRAGGAQDNGETMIPEKGKDLPAAVATALSQGQKIEAIKLLREAHGIGLKEAKDIVEDYIKSRPELSVKLTAIQEEKKRGFSAG